MIGANVATIKGSIIYTVSKIISLRTILILQGTFTDNWLNILIPVSFFQMTKLYHLFLYKFQNMNKISHFVLHLFYLHHFTDKSTMRRFISGMATLPSAFYTFGHLHHFALKTHILIFFI